MIIDCHTHLSTHGRDGQTFRQVLDALLHSMRSCGIAYSLVFPDSELGTCVSDLDTTIDLTSDQPELFVLGTARIPKLSSDTVARLGSLASEGTIVGIKLYPGFEEFFPTDKDCRPIYDVCLRYHLPVIFHSGETMGQRWREKYSDPECIASLARQLPGLQIVVAHFCQPHICACRDLLLQNANVHADISSLAHPSVMNACGARTIENALTTVALHNPAQLLFGTDWPLCSVEAHLNLVRSLPVPDSTKTMTLSGNALRVFGLRGFGT